MAQKNGILGSFIYAVKSTRSSRRNFGKSLKEDVKAIARIPLYFVLDLCAGEFDFLGEKHRYFYHPYNNTWRNERCAEIPIVWEEMQSAAAGGKRILEVGNVLSHYFPVSHDIVDKYEKAQGVKNEDIVSFAPTGKYGLIVSISTLEHVGFDETPKDQKKVLLAFENLQKLLLPGGRAIVTFGMGHNPNIDVLAIENKIPGFKWHFLKRDAKNKWSSSTADGAKGAKYGSPYPAANFLAIGSNF